MTWVRTEENAPTHTKFFLAGCAAYGWWHAGLCYCNRELTDGFIPVRALRLVFPGLTDDETLALVERLVTERVLHTVSKGQRPACGHRGCPRQRAPEDGYVMHDYFDFQPRRSEVLTRRRIRSVVGRQGGVRSGISRKQIASTETNPVPSRPVPSRPVLDTKTLTTLSGNGAGPHPPRQLAKQILGFLNEKTGRSYRPTAANLRLIEARLRDGATVEDCRGVIARKWREWGTDPKMAEFVRPKTLFGATNFEQYLGQKEAPRELLS